jgi:hypothetical protein
LPRRVRIVRGLGGHAGGRRRGAAAPLAHTPAAPPAAPATPQASPRPPLHLAPGAAGAPGLASGVVLGAATAAALLAVQAVGLPVAYPVVQLGLFVAGLWGVLLYGELGFLVPQLVWWLSGAAVVAGVGLMTGAARDVL